jgi:hypothetical protein
VRERQQVSDAPTRCGGDAAGSESGDGRGGIPIGAAQSDTTGAEQLGNQSYEFRFTAYTVTLKIDNKVE